MKKLIILLLFCSTLSAQQSFNSGILVKGKSEFKDSVKFRKGVDIRGVSRIDNDTIKGIQYIRDHISGGGGGSGTVTNITATNTPGISWTIASPTTTPNLTINLDTVSNNGVATQTDLKYLHVKTINFDTTITVPSYLIGTLYYDASNYTLSLHTGLGRSTQQIGQELYTIVQNNTGSLIENGRAVFIYSSGGDIPRITLADSSYASTSYKVIGIATSDIPHGGLGFITTYGNVHDLNTNGIEGQEVYLYNSGTWGVTKPKHHRVRIGIVTYGHSSNGIMNVHINKETFTQFSVLDNDGSKQILLDTTGVKTIGGIDYYKGDSVLPTKLAVDAKINLKAPLLTPIFQTNITTPYIIGGTSATQSITYKTTTGVGTIGSDHIFLVGNNGADTSMKIKNDKSVAIGAGLGTPLSTLHIKGYGATSGTSSLKVTNSSNVDLLTVKNDGQIVIREGYPINWQGAGAITGYTNRLIFTGTGTNSVYMATFGSSNGIFNLPSSSQGVINITGTVQPTSGTGIHNALTIDETINQTGTATGINRGIYMPVILTSAVDYRAFEATQNSHYVFYQSGANAINYFNGKTGFGTTTPDSAITSTGGLKVRGAKITKTLNVGTINKVSIDTTNSIRLSGTSTVWNDMMFPFSLGNNGGNTYPTFDADSMYYSFVIDTTGITKCIQYMTVQLPHSIKENSQLYPHVHYKYETGVGTPTFKVKYKWYSIGGTTQKDYQWYTMPNTTGTTDKTHQMCYGTGGITGDGISAILICQIYLTSQTGTGNVHAWQFDIHYEQDALGSNTETTK